MDLTDIKESIVVTAKVPNQSKETKRSLLSRGVPGSNVENFSNAPQDSNKVIEQDKPKGDADYKEAMDLYNQGSYKEAIERCSSAIELEPTCFIYKLKRALMYSFLNRFEEAMNDLVDLQGVLKDINEPGIKIYNDFLNLAIYMQEKLHQLNVDVEKFKMCKQSKDESMDTLVSLLENINKIYPIKADKLETSYLLKNERGEEQKSDHPSKSKAPDLKNSENPSLSWFKKEVQLPDDSPEGYEDSDPFDSHQKEEVQLPGDPPEGYEDSDPFDSHQKEEVQLPGDPPEGYEDSDPFDPHQKEEVQQPGDPPEGYEDSDPFDSLQKEEAKQSDHLSETKVLDQIQNFYMSFPSALDDEEKSDSSEYKNGGSQQSNDLSKLKQSEDKYQKLKESFTALKELLFEYWDTTIFDYEKKLDLRLKKASVLDEDKKKCMDYFKEFINTWTSVYEVSQIIVTDLVKLQTNDLKITVLSTLVSFVPSIGDFLKTGINTLHELYQKKQIKENAQIIISLGYDLFSFRQLISDCAYQILLNSEKRDQISTIEENDFKEEDERFNSIKKQLKTKKGFEVYNNDFNKSLASKLGRSDANQLIREWRKSWHKEEMDDKQVIKRFSKRTINRKLAQ